MSIIIKGMDMPKGCNECAQFWCEHWRLRYATVTLKRPEDCPLVEIPTPHGRLIDAKELEKKGSVAWMVALQPTILTEEE